MEQVRWPNGGLNTDDSIESLPPEDWLHARNIVDNRASGKYGEKENVRGTSQLEDISITTDVTENSSFLTWTNVGSGESWSLSSTPSVSLDDSETSKELNLVLSTPVTSGPLTVAFNYSITNVVQGPVTIYCTVKSSSTVVETKNIVTSLSNGTASFAFTIGSPVDNISIYTSVGGSTPVNINDFGNAGDYETEVSTWGYSSTFNGIVTRESYTKTKGNYSQRFLCTSTSVSLLTVNPVAFANAPAASVTVGKRFTMRANVYVPSSSPIAAGGFTISITSDQSNFIPNPHNPLYTVVSSITKTVSECINTWQTIETVVDITDNSFNFNLTPFISVQNGFSAMTLNGEIYVDEFYIYEPVSARTLTLSSPVVTKQIQDSSILDDNSKIIGVIRSAKDDLNYLFFYNTNPDKNCILKLHNDVLFLVLRWSGLNFSNLKANRINGGGLTDNSIYFTDNFNQPRCVHLTRYSSGATPLSEDEILLIKKGPTYAPVITETTSSTYGSVTLDDDYQFAIQYVYLDGQLSVLSPYTKVIKKNTSSKIVSVTVGLATNETIPILVEEVRYIVKKGSTGTPFVFDDVTLPYSSNPDRSKIYYGDSYGEVIESIYDKPFESIPIQVGTMAIAKSRLWLGNYIEGYDTPNTADITFSMDTIGSNLDEGYSYSANSKFRLGAVFYDSQGRSSGVLDKGWVLSVSPELYRAIASNGAKKRLRYRISGTAPSWVTHYALVMSKDLVKSSFVEGTVGSAPQKYVIVSSTGTETYTDTYSSSVTYIRIRLLVEEGFYYAAKEGDYAIITPNTASINNSGPLKVIKQSGNYVYVEPRDLGFSSSVTFNYQIYTPAITSDDLYYEVGEKRAVVGGALDTTDYFLAGDCISLVTNDTFNTKTTQMNYTSKSTWSQNSGKPFLKLEVGQVQKQTYFKYSSPFIANSEINGLSEFNVGDESNVAFESGKIQKLQPTLKESTDGDVLLAICNSDTYSIYIDESRVSSGDSSFLVASPRVIGDVRKQRSGYGTLHPESLHEEDGYVYFYDKLSRSYCRYASNGIFPISEYKMVRYLEDQSLLNNESDIVLTGYDPFYKIIFVTFKNSSTSYKKTVGFSLVKERWISWYDFAPDVYIIGSNKMYSVVDGNIYKHDNTEDYNTYYDTPYNSELTVSFNDAPDKPKEWKCIEVLASDNLTQFANGDQELQSFGLYAEITNGRGGQMTDIQAHEFEVDEYMIYGEIRGDSSSGGVLNGDSIYSNTIQCKIVFPSGEYHQVFMLKAGCEISRGHNL